MIRNWFSRGGSERATHTDLAKGPSSHQSPVPQVVHGHADVGPDARAMVHAHASSAVNGHMHLDRAHAHQNLLYEGRKWAVITGASQGLGRAFAQECARLGLDLMLVALPGSGLEETSQSIVERYGVQVEFLEMDLTEQGQPEALCHWVLGKGVPVSLLINNAGVGYNSRFQDSTLSENEACILLNNLALVKITRLLLPELKQHSVSAILNVASLAAFFPMPFMPVYAPSKAFILSFSLALREELRHTPVRVSVLCPNGIRTNASCTDKIRAAGLAGELTCMSPDLVAAQAIRALVSGKAVIVPGFVNRLLMAMGRFIPLRAVYAIVSMFWGRTTGPERPGVPVPATTLYVVGRQA